MASPNAPLGWLATPTSTPVRAGGFATFASHRIPIHSIRRTEDCRGLVNCTVTLRKDKPRSRRLDSTNHLLDILDPFFELSAPPTQPADFTSELFAHHFRLLALPLGSMMSPTPPKDAFLSRSEDTLPRLVASRTTGLSVPHKSGEGPVADSWEVQDERRV